MEYDTMLINLFLTLHRLAASIIKVAKNKLFGMQLILPEIYYSSPTLMMGISSFSATSVTIFPNNTVKNDTVQKSGMLQNPQLW
jgi:hypothetical protein